MEKKTGIILMVIGVVIVALIALAFGLEGTTEQLSADEILRINKEVYARSEFEDYVKYVLYKNNGEMHLEDDGHDHSAELEAGSSEEDIFLSDTLNDFYQMKVYGIVGKDKKITLTSEEVEQIDSDFEAESEKILAYGLTKESFVNIEEQQAIMEKISYSPNEYIELPDEVYNEYLSSFSGDDLKSYTFRMFQVGYTNDTVSGEISGESSGEVISGDKVEKEAYMNSLIARIESGEAFETVGESGDNRLIMTGNGINFGKCPVEYAAGMLLEQKLGEDLYAVAKETEVGKMTTVVDTGDAFQVAKIEKVEEGIVGEAKNELVELLISEAASDLIYSYVKDMEVNNSAMSRIKIK